MRVVVSESGDSATAVDVEFWGLVASVGPSGDALAVLRGPALDDYSGFLARHGETCRSPSSIELVTRAEVGWLSGEPVPDALVKRTLQLHGWARAELLELLESATDEELDWCDPTRTLPFGWWYSSRQMAYHVAVTESSYYLGRLGVPVPARVQRFLESFPDADWSTGGPVWPVPQPDMFALLDESAAHVHATLPSVDRSLVREVEGERWSVVEVLALLNWHERGETFVVRQLLDRARLALA